MLSDKIANQENELEHSDGFIDITYYSKDDLSKLSIGDFVKFFGTFCFNSIRNMAIHCENSNFSIKVSYTPNIDDSNDFTTDMKYETTFKGIWGSFVVDLFDIESSFSEAHEYKSLEDCHKEPNNTFKDTDSKSTLDKLLEQQYWNTELVKENEDLSKKLIHAQCTNRNLKKQVETLSKQVETLTKKFNNTSGELNETHKQVLDYKNERDDIIVKYNNLVRTYNQLRKDYICLKDKELKVSVKNIIFQIVEIILLSPLVMFKWLLIFSLLTALFGLFNI